MQPTPRNRDARSQDGLATESKLVATSADVDGFENARRRAPRCRLRYSRPLALSRIMTEQRARRRAQNSAKQIGTNFNSRNGRSAEIRHVGSRLTIVDRRN